MSREMVLLGIPDVNGSLRGKALSHDAFERALRDGTVMTDLLLALDPTDQPITAYDRIGVRSGAGDLLVRPEPDTLRELTWRPGWSICLATPWWPDGSSCAFASREVLRNALTEMTAVGYDVSAAFEYEMRLADEAGRPLSSGLSYSLAEIGRFADFTSHLCEALKALSIESAAIHTEAGPGLLEINIHARNGLRAADEAALLKLAAKEVATSLGLTASFLAKTASGEEGSGGHVHLSCWTGESNAFASTGPDLNNVLEAAVGGVLEHLPAASLLLNPTINSYKRLVPGWFAPINVSWGIENRTAAVRVIRSGHPKLCRIECRRPGADANPYLALAALVCSAADGIRRAASAPPAVEGDAGERRDLPALPGSLESALAAFEADTTFREALGMRFSEYYATSREWELRAWQSAVSDWERERYVRAV